METSKDPFSFWTSEEFASYFDMKSSPGNNQTCPLPPLNAPSASQSSELATALITFFISLSRT